MKLKINGGMLDVEALDSLSDLRKQLKQLAQEDTDKATSDIKEAGTLNDVSTKYPMGKLSKQPKIPI